MIEEAKSKTQTGPEAPDIVKTIKSRVYLWLGLPGLVVLVVIGYAWTNWDSAKEWAGVSSRVQAQTSPKPEAVPASTATVSGGEFKPEQGAIDIGSTVHNYVVPPERLEKLSKELGVTQAALQSFFEIVEKKQVPARELDTTLRQIATSYNELLLKYEIITSDDPDVKALKEQARTALEARNFTQAEELLNQASDADVTAAGQMQAQANKRFVSAAESKAGNGAIQETQLNYPEAVAYYREAAELVESIRDAWEDWVSYLYRRGLLASRAGSHAEAQAAWEQALIIQEEKLGPEDPAVATSLNNLAGLYQTQGKYAEAVPPLERALAIWQAVHGPNHPDVAVDLNNLAGLYKMQGKYTEAEPLYRQALAVMEVVHGSKHPHVATSLNNLAKSTKRKRSMRRRYRCWSRRWQSMRPPWVRRIPMWRLRLN